MHEFEKRLACVISAGGDIVRGYMIDKCRFDSTNKYTISWQIPLQGVAKTNFAGTIGSALGEAVAPGLITVGLGEDPVEMHVHTFASGGKPALWPTDCAC